MLFFFIAFIIQDLPVCESANTELGVITCHHCGFNRAPSVAFPALDIQIFRHDRRRFIHKVSDAKPSYFYDRRGNRHVIITKGRTKTYWKTACVFFNGESGLAVFDKRDRVCGIVLGNVRSEKLWLGRVARFDVFLQSIDRGTPELKDQLDRLRSPQPDVRSTPEPQDNEPSFHRSISPRPTTAPQVIHGTLLRNP